MSFNTPEETCYSTNTSVNAASNNLFFFFYHFVFLKLFVFSQRGIRERTGSGRISSAWIVKDLISLRFQDTCEAWGPVEALGALLSAAGLQRRPHTVQSQEGSAELHLHLRACWCLPNSCCSLTSSGGFLEYWCIQGISRGLRALPLLGHPQCKLDRGVG